MSDKVGGRIVRIKIKGFMTYDELEIKPTKGLNLIIGLNGSGKSSIMSAICLGLGGKPQFTGRTVQLSDFIKYKYTKANIEIELESPRGKNDIINRIIQTDNKQQWYLNGKLVQPNEITSVIKKYNIDMSNLCQFLPQEKVAEFAKMDKKQRLANMIQAMGDPNLVTLFEELKGLRNNFSQIKKNLEELEDNKLSEEKMNERLKPEIKRQEERMKLESELRLLKFEKMGCEYENLKSEVQKYDTDIKDINRDIFQIEKELNELKAEKSNKSTESRTYQSKFEEMKGKISKCIQILKKYYSSLSACHEEIDNAKIYFKTRMQEKEDQEQQLVTLIKQITGLKEALLLKKGDVAVLNQKLVNIANEFENVKQRLSVCDSEMENLNLKKNALEYKKRAKEQEINKMSNEENKKYEVLRQKYPDAFTALQWLQQNKNSFKSPISPPPLVSIKVQNDECRKFIENTVSSRDLLMFICEDKKDLERFVNIMKHEKKLSINVALVPEETLDDFPSPSIDNRMRDLGIQCYLKDLFTAPDSVMRYLCKLNKVHRVPVCNERAEGNIDSILNYCSLFFTTSERIFGKRSQYGQKSMSVKRDVLVSKNILPTIKDNSEALLLAKREYQEIEKTLQNYKPQFEALENQRTQLERQQEQLRTQKNSINAEKKKLQDLQIKIAKFTDTYERKEKDLVDKAAEQEKITSIVCNVNAKKLEILTEIQKITKEILISKKEKSVSILYLKSFIEKISSLEEKISSLAAQLNSKKSHLTELQSFKSHKKSEAKRLLQQIYAAKDATENQLELSMFLGSRAHSLEEIEQKISNVEAQLELTNEDIAPIMAEYKRREQTILNIAEQASRLNAKIEELKVRIEEKKKIWLPPLTAQIETVNKKFSKYFKILNCAGEITLDQTDDTDDFPNYGLQIKLQYRADEEFMELSQTHHSGGECSIAAIIFILSLQELTDVPFRCIDEINQGMDSVNERKMYQLVADAAKSASCSQYFLLTPKLLMDLSYHKDVAVHIIFNSPFLQAKLNVQEHLKIRKALRH